MKTLLRSVILSASISWVAVAHAEDIQDIPPGDDVIVAVKKGAPAPFDGQIFDINTSLRWANWLEQYKDKVEADEMKSKALCLSEIGFLQDVNDVELSRAEKLNKDLKVRLLRSEQGRLQAEHERDNPAWYSSVWFGVVTGVVVTSGLVLLGTQAF